jgi:hypothetical protein
MKMPYRSGGVYYVKHDRLGGGLWLDHVCELEKAANICSDADRWGFPAFS